MIASILIIIFSVVLLVYWFRYTCLLLLQTETSNDYVAPVVDANGLQFPDVREKLGAEPELALDGLHRALDHDYRILVFLQHHAADLNISSLEQRMLAMDYAVMQVWYRLTRDRSTSQARKALGEMSAILAQFANSMGETLTAQSRAA